MAKTDKYNITLPKELKPKINKEMKVTGRNKSNLFAYILNLYFDKNQ